MDGYHLKQLTGLKGVNDGQTDSHDGPAQAGSAKEIPATPGRHAGPNADQAPE